MKNMFNSTNSLEYCKYNELNSNFANCSKVITLKVCPTCDNNDNMDEYCSSTLGSTIVKFRYLKNETNITINNRQCLWYYDEKNHNELYLGEEKKKKK